MPIQRISMRKLREVCRLRFQAHLSLRQISNSTQVSLGAIQKIVATVTQQGLDWPAIQALDDTHLSALIYPKPAESNLSTQKELPDWAEVHREVKPKGMTLQLLWEEPEGCSYRMAVISMKKQYAGHAKRVMLGTWSYLRQFMYTKFVIVVDDDIDVHDWQEVIWAITTRMDPVRDLTILENTPIDYLGFASPVSGLGAKVGFYATNKWPGETTREWGRTIEMSKEVVQKIDELWDSLGIDKP